MGWNEWNGLFLAAISISVLFLAQGSDALADLARLTSVASGPSVPTYDMLVLGDSDRPFVVQKWEPMGNFNWNPSAINAAHTASDMEVEESQSSAVPEPSGVLLSGCFVALLVLIAVLRWQFDRRAVRR